jgi:hypothetical protein
VRCKQASTACGCHLRTWRHRKDSVGVKVHRGSRRVLEEAVKSILEKKPRLREKYQRLDPSSDRLYQTRVVHPNDEASCATVCGDDPATLILRPERSEDEDNPAIHYGLIASANQLMKDALVRDRLAAEKNVLCSNLCRPSFPPPLFFVSPSEHTGYILEGKIALGSHVGSPYCESICYEDAKGFWALRNLRLEIAKWLRQTRGMC